MPVPSQKTLCTSCQHILQSCSCLTVLFRPVNLHLFTQKFFKFWTAITFPLGSHSNPLAVPSRTFAQLRHLFSLSHFDFPILPLFLIFNYLIGSTNKLLITFRWFNPHSVLVDKLQCAIDGSPLVFPLLPTSRLRKSSLLFCQKLMPGLTFIFACILLAMQLFLLVSSRNMNFVKYMTTCSWNCASCRITLLLQNYSEQMTTTAPALVPALNYCWHLQPSFTGLTYVEDFLTQLELLSTLSDWVALTTEPFRHFFPLTRAAKLFSLVPHHCPKKQLRQTQAYLLAQLQTQRWRFEGPNQILLPINPTRRVRFLPEPLWP